MTPLVRKLAAQHGIDLATVKAPAWAAESARLTFWLRPRRKAAAAAPAAPLLLLRLPLPQLRPRSVRQAWNHREDVEAAQTIAKHMVDSLQTAAQLTATVEVDMTAVSRVRNKAKDAFKAREGVGLSYLPFIAKAAVEALRQFPVANATVDSQAGTITYNATENLSIAVDTPKGLIVGHQDAGDLSIGGLAKKIADVAADPVRSDHPG